MLENGGRGGTWLQFSGQGPNRSDRCCTRVCKELFLSGPHHPEMMVRSSDLTPQGGGPTWCPTTCNPIPCAVSPHGIHIDVEPVGVRFGTKTHRHPANTATKGSAAQHQTKEHKTMRQCKPPLPPPPLYCRNVGVEGPCAGAKLAPQGRSGISGHHGVGPPSAVAPPAGRKAERQGVPRATLHRPQPHGLSGLHRGNSPTHTTTSPRHRINLRRLSQPLGSGPTRLPIPLLPRPDHCLSVAAPSAHTRPPPPLPQTHIRTHTHTPTLTMRTEKQEQSKKSGERKLLRSHMAALDVFHTHAHTHTHTHIMRKISVSDAHPLLYCTPMPTRSPGGQEIASVRSTGCAAVRMQ